MWLYKCREQGVGKGDLRGALVLSVYVSPSQLRRVEEENWIFQTGDSLNVVHDGAVQRGGKKASRFPGMSWDIMKKGVWNACFLSVEDSHLLSSFLKSSIFSIPPVSSSPPVLSKQLFILCCSFIIFMKEDIFRLLQPLGRQKGQNKDHLLERLPFNGRNRWYASDCYILYRGDKELKRARAGDQEALLVMSFCPKETHH